MLKAGKKIVLTLSWRNSLSYRNQYIDLQSKLMDLFLYDSDLLPESVKLTLFYVYSSYFSYYFYFLYNFS